MKKNGEQKPLLQTNPFDKVKEPQRFEDWNAGYCAAVAVQVQFQPNAGDALAGMGLRILLRAVNPSALKTLEKIGIAPGHGLGIRVKGGVK